ncbi:MAG: hypothetical protein HXY41_08875 [Chloroflexi bacterium]|nr:hypothetical protein [Chloroflexota bacterium]
MNLLVRLFGPPHEFLHLLALWLIGRRAVSFTRSHVEIPADVTTRQYVFVAGLPALVFWSAAAVGLLGALNAPDAGRFVIALIAAAVATLAGIGTLGDLHLIILRLLQDRSPEP